MLEMIMSQLFGVKINMNIEETPFKVNIIVSSSLFTQ